MLVAKIDKRISYSGLGRRKRRKLKRAKEIPKQNEASVSSNVL